MSSNETTNIEKTKIYKGDFGYMKYRKKVEIAKTLFLLALSVILYVAGYIARTGKRPVVFIDYLQILQPTESKKGKQTKKSVI